MEEGHDIVIKQQNLVIRNIIDYAMASKLQHLAPDELIEIRDRLQGVY